MPLNSPLPKILSIDFLIFNLCKFWKSNFSDKGLSIMFLAKEMFLRSNIAPQRNHYILSSVEFEIPSFIWKYKIELQTICTNWPLAFSSIVSSMEWKIHFTRLKKISINLYVNLCSIEMLVLKNLHIHVRFCIAMVLALVFHSTSYIIHSFGTKSA